MDEADDLKAQIEVLSAHVKALQAAMILLVMRAMQIDKATEPMGARFSYGEQRLIMSDALPLLDDFPKTLGAIREPHDAFGALWTCALGRYHLP